MTQSEQLIVYAAAAMILICLVGPAAVWRITKVMCEWLLVLLVLIWVL